MKDFETAWNNLKKEITPPFVKLYNKFANICINDKVTLIFIVVIVLFICSLAIILG